MPSAARYGTWKSPIEADLITQKTIGIAEVHVDPSDGTIYHLESRPSEGGRIVVVDTAGSEDVIPEGWNARTGVHEYGGAAATVRDGVVYFTDYSKRRIYKVEKGGKVEPVTPDNSNHRFGDFVAHPTKSHLLVSVLEDHTKPAPADVVNSVVLVDTSSQSVTTIASGADFYSTPRLDPSGERISWIQWYHPDMPWEGSELAVAPLASPEKFKIIAGKQGEESINEAFWVSSETLVFLSDRSGFYNPWKYDVKAQNLSPILKSPVSHEYAEPAWLLGASRWAALSEEKLLISPTDNGVVYLAILHLEDGSITRISSPYVDIHSVKAINGTEAVFVGVTDNSPSALIHMKLKSDTEAVFKTLKVTSSDAGSVPAGIFPTHQAIALKLTDGSPLHVLYFSPTNPDYEGGVDGEKPPCVVSIHGGPTARTPPGLNWKTTYFTSRGWAWVDVNYGGSSGFGRDHRDRLRGNWGIVDVEDAVAAVQLLGEKGLIDPQRAAIRGGSAGGYTVLASLVTKPTAFTAATSSYGVSDLAMLAGDTHKFESRYLDKLIGGTLQEIPDVYEARSPVHHADRIAVPLLILQGSIDAVVPPSQAEAIVKQVQGRGGKVDYIVFEGEGHGWRKAENIKTALIKEESFYREVFGLN